MKFNKKITGDHKNICNETGLLIKNIQVLTVTLTTIVIIEEVFMSLNQLVDSRDVRFILFEMLELEKLNRFERFKDFDKSYVR
ncbi:MAG: acyl-CoA dehydrogenase N-terminal domain-containing protein [Anaerotruncus sp.]|nr:acyl-CoA dehydrogenase N-terminal domain-containing protein [Anaerotruncus sp.]